MKALLYRKFASGETMFFSMVCIFAVSVAFWLKYNDELISVYLVNLFCAGTLVRSIGESEKVGWDSYSRALPVSVYERVGARYIFWYITLLLPFLFYSGLYIFDILTERTGVNGSFQQVFADWISSDFVILIITEMLFVLASAFSLPVSYAIKKSGVRSLIMSLPLIPAYLGIIFIYVVDILGGYNNLINALYSSPIVILISVSVLLIFAASFCFSVIFETKTEREKLKAVKAAAAVLTVAATVFSSATVGVLYDRGAFTKTSDSIWDKMEDYRNQEQTTDISELIPEEATRYDNSERRAAMLEITEKICGKTFVDKKMHEAEKLFEEMGFGDMVNPEYDEFPPATIRIYNRSAYDENPEYSDRISITSSIDPNLIVYPDAYDSYNDAEKKHAEILDRFRIGTTEEEALEHMKELGLCPCEISEQLRGNVPFRTYSFEIDYYSEYKNAVKPTVGFSFDVIDGRVSKVT